MLLKEKISVLLVSIVVLLSQKSPAQDLLIPGNDYGFNIGLNLALGTHFQRLGINCNFYFTKDIVQANTEVRAYYNFKSLGPKLRYPELVLSQGLLLGYGSKKNLFNPFLSTISNQTVYKNSVAYAYNVYLNNKKTSQQTGSLAFQFDRITFIADNDLLAKPALDRFRTGAFLLQYQYGDILQAAINCSMWTGKMGNKCGIINPRFHYQCYMDTTLGVYPETSHGLLSAQLKYHAGYSQIAQVNVGVDAEQVRNAVQNHFIHDMRFIPKRYNKARNCHIPMLDDQGNQYLYRDGQKVKPTRLYLNVFANHALFY